MTIIRGHENRIVKVVAGEVVTVSIATPPSIKLADSIASNTERNNTKTPRPKGPRVRIREISRQGETERKPNDPNENRTILTETERLLLRLSLNSIPPTGVNWTQ